MEHEAVELTLEWARTQAPRRIADWLAEAASAAQAYPVLFWITLALAVFAAIAARSAVMALATAALAALGLWFIGRTGQTDAAVAAALLCWIALLACGTFGLQSHRRRRRLRSLLQSSRDELAETQNLLAREVEWRMAASQPSSTANVARVPPGSSSPASSKDDA